MLNPSLKQNYFFGQSTACQWFKKIFLRKRRNYGLPYLTPVFLLGKGARLRSSSGSGLFMEQKKSLYKNLILIGGPEKALRQMNSTVLVRIKYKVSKRDKRRAICTVRVSIGGCIHVMHCSAYNF